MAYALARIGVGHLHLIDFDVVDITNLNRQQYFIDQIGMYKTDALKSLLERINPYLDIRTDTVKVTEENLQELLLMHRSSVSLRQTGGKGNAGQRDTGTFPRKEISFCNRNGRLWKQ